MKRSVVWIVLAAALASIAAGQAQDTKAKGTTAPQRPKETFWEWALRFTGISANPNTLKSGDELVAGQVWVADLASGTSRKITSDGSYRSPVYFPTGSEILALQGDGVVRLSAGGYKTEKLYSIAGIAKIVGFSRGGPAEVLILAEDDAGQVSAARLSIITGTVTPIPFEPQSERDRQMLEHLRGWQRSYGDTTVYVKREPRQTFSGPVEVLNVFLKTPGRNPQNVSGCALLNCGQPSLSPDGNRVVFVKEIP
jgi:Tol biopolymer transport system component